MSTISDKLPYLDVTRSKIKDTINYTGAGITESDTFRSYARTLKDSFVDIINDGTGTLYDNFPKATDEGSNTTLNNVYEAPMKLEVEGKSEQDSYSGKNKANTTGNPDYLYGNTSYEKDGDNIIVKMLTNSSYAFVQYYIDDLKPNTTYRFSFDAVSTNNGVISADVMKNRDGAPTSSRLIRLDSATSGHVSGQFTTPNDTSAMAINLYSIRGTYYENASVEYSNIQIEEGSSETSYEPYVGGTPSPNPDYPQEIKSVSGIENLLNLDTTSYGYINDSGNVAGTGSHVNRLTDYIRFDENMTVSLSTTIYGIGYALFDENKNYLSRVGSVADISKYTISSSSAKYIRIWFNYDSSSDTTIELLSNLKAMIESGTTPHTPVPYGHWLPVKVSNKNLFDNDILLNATDWVKNEDGYYTGTAYNLKQYSDAHPITGFKENTRYTISSTSYSSISTSGGRFVISYTDGTIDLKPLGQQTTATFVYSVTASNKTVSSITFSYSKGHTLYIKDLQIEEGTTATEYIEHQEQTTLIDLNKENLFDKNSQITLDTSYTTTGGTTTSTGSFIQESYISVTPNTIYTISTEVISSVFRICEYANDKTFIVRQAINNTSSFTFTTNSTTYYIRISGISENIDTMQLVKGSSTTPYYEICSIGDTKDLLTIKDGKAILNKNITNIVLDGNEDWTIGSQTYNNLHFFTTTSITDFKKGQTGVSLNIFKTPYFHYISKASNADLGGSYFINTMFLVFMNFTTIVDFKTWLSTHNIELYYALETPETITLKGTYNVKTYEDITHISIDDDLEPNMIASGLTWE